MRDSPQEKTTVEIDQCQECGRYTETSFCWFEGNGRDLCAECVPHVAEGVPLLLLLNE